MSVQEDNLLPLPQHPKADDINGWRNYWEEHNQPWRSEPEIDNERQEFLARCRTIKPDYEKGIYPYKDIILSRSDIEWLLATHENGRGPVDWSEEHQRIRKGLDLRGAILSGIDLRNLPLARIYGGPTIREWDTAIPEQRDMARIHLEGTILGRAHLEGANLSGAYMEGTTLFGAFIERAFLVEVHLEGAILRRTHLEGAYLRNAHLEGAYLTQAHLEGADLTGAHLEGKEIHTHDLKRVQKWAKAITTILSPAELCGTFLDSATNLENVTFGDDKFGFVLVADVHWGDVNHLTVDWAAVKMLGDERKARQHENLNGEMKDRETQFKEYQAAVRANRQLAVVLHEQGMNEEASHFAYRAQILQRGVLWRQQKVGRYLFSLFLDLFAGYGYKPARSFISYLFVIGCFTTIYYFLGQLFGPTLSPVGAFVFSMTSFHGRGFFPGGIKLDGPLTVLAAIEAFVGLIIEVSFIATFTQRFFGK